ncbi:unnamed protein product [Lathyrus sativus]|nr:unnamed protein product [Lathyrus sativus]
MNSSEGTRNSTGFDRVTHLQSDPRTVQQLATSKRIQQYAQKNCIQYERKSQKKQQNGYRNYRAKRTLCISITDSPKPPPERIAFIFPVINASAYIALVVTGTGKADMVHSVLSGFETADRLPAALVSPEGELKWFVDKSAASKL